MVKSVTHGLARTGEPRFTVYSHVEPAPPPLEFDVPVLTQLDLLAQWHVENKGNVAGTAWLCMEVRGEVAGAWGPEGLFVRTLPGRDQWETLSEFSGQFIFESFATPKLVEPGGIAEILTSVRFTSGFHQLVPQERFVSLFIRQLAADGTFEAVSPLDRPSSDVVVRGGHRDAAILTVRPASSALESVGDYVIIVGG